MDSTSILETLQHAANGLYFPSEADATFTAFFWADGAPTSPSPELLAKHTEIASDAHIETVPLDDFFRPATEEKDWYEDEEKAEAQKFRDLLDIIHQSLDDVKVFRAGEVEIDVYIVGTVDGGWAGLHTLLVET